MNKEKVMIAMSGGVDSSVAVCLMQETGAEVCGATMKLYVDENASILKSIADAKSVAAKMGIEHYTFEMEEPFAKNVINRFIKAYEQGLTPNPCVVCNRYMKFGLFLQEAEKLGCDAVATGHYAKIEKQGDRYLLKKAKDLKKDQSYVLYSLTQEKLKKVRFPLGDYSKPEIREIAEAHGFVNAHKHDSQDICFVPDGDYCRFITGFNGKTYPEGDFVDLEGKRLGTHKGIIRYTIGQRRGLGLALPASMYVCEKNVENNQVVLGFNEDLMSKEVYLGDVVFSACDRLDKEEHFMAKIRYNQKEQPARVIQTDETHVKLIFDEPQRAVTKGQAAVIYDGDTVIGGGTIL